MWRLRGWIDLEGLKRAGLVVGDDVFIGLGVHLDPAFCFLISIGPKATLSLNVTVLAHDASTRRIMGFGRIAPVSIGANAFVGASAIILPGVTVGDGAIVGAGSVVRHDVPAGAVVAGNPAKVIGSREHYEALHTERAERLPTWPRQGWTATTGITAARRREIIEALEEHGEAYIK